MKRRMRLRHIRRWCGIDLCPLCGGRVGPNPIGSNVMHRCPVVKP